MNEKPALKPAGKIGCMLLVLGLAFGLFKVFGSKIFPTALPTGNSGNTSGTSLAPSTDPSDVCSNGKTVNMLVWAWNAQMGLMNANGAPSSTSKSMMCQNGVNLKLQRQDDPTKMQEGLVAFATALSQGNANPETGTHFVAIMGDGGAAFLKGLNDTLSKLGPDYKAKVIGSIGYSRGEDKFMGPQQWKDNPQTAMGGVVTGYLRDGDWNIAMKWLQDNGLKNNPDEKTYDPEALNWVGSSDYIDAATKYVGGYSEERTVVRNGKPTGQKRKVSVQGVVTWTPGDVIVAQKKGGLVSIISTKDYSTQMPCIIIGIDKWMKQNPEKVQGMLSAIYDGGAKVKGDSGELQKAAVVANAVYKQDDTGPNYWVKYYNGVTEKDKTGNDVELGGSLSSDLRDGAATFGLLPGTANAFEATYTTFGNIVKKEYPDMLPSFYSASDITDVSYLKSIASKLPSAIVNATPEPIVPSKPDAPKVDKSSRNWDIKFATGKASFMPQTMQTLEQLRRDLLVAQNLSIEIQGHTDNVGDPAKNQSLSEARAFAVKKWLQSKNPANFPDSRFEVTAFGQSKPLVENSSEANRAKNRRVKIIMKGTE
jgi:OmpA-OmpF porin, OOP family